MGDDDTLTRRILTLATVALLAAGRGDSAMALTVRSTAFEHRKEIPRDYTCEGSDVSPPLSWEGAPGGTKSLVLIVDDPDAPDPKNPKVTWVHWVVWDIPPTAGSLPEGASEGKLPAGAREGLNDWKRTGYGGPCPPIGRHRYVHKLYALDTMLGEIDGAGKPEVERAMQGHILGQTELVGTYEKKNAE